MNHDMDMVEALKAENEALRQRIAELEQQPSRPVQTITNLTDPIAWNSWQLLQTVLDTFPDPIFVKDLQHRWIACNQSFCSLIGHSRDQIIGYSDPDRWPPEQAAVFWEKDDEVFHSGEPVFNEELATGADGMTRTIWTRKFPLCDDQGVLIGLCGIITDITDIKQRREELDALEMKIREEAETERTALQQQVIDAQQEAIRELSTPLIPLSHNVVLMPLIGSIDSRRAQMVMESLLEGIAAQQADTAILDITGVSVVDTQVANALVQTAQAVRLLGAQVVLTGIGPTMAQTLVYLGADLSTIRTRGSLQQAVVEALGLSHRPDETEELI